jgi:hypothetical protein
MNSDGKGNLGTKVCANEEKVDSSCHIDNQALYRFIANCRFNLSIIIESTLVVSRFLAAWSLLW